MSVNNKLQEAIEKLKNSSQSITQPATQPINQQVSTPSKMEWNRVSLDFGVVAPNSQQDYSFTYLGKNKITQVNTSCGCTSAIVENKKVQGSWSVASDWSQSTQTNIKTSKTVSVVFEDGSTQILSLNATVNKTYQIQ